MKLFIIFFALTTFSLNAKITRFEATGTTKDSFTLRQVCEEMNYKHILLTSAIDVNSFDCMGNTVLAGDYCLKKYPNDKKLMRGLVDQTNNTLICQHARTLSLSLECTKGDSIYCEEAKEGCNKLKKLFAYNLNLTHQSIVDRHLNCYFVAEEDEKIELTDKI